MGWKTYDQAISDATVRIGTGSVAQELVSKEEKKIATLRKVLNVMCVHVKIDGYNIVVPVVNQLQSLAHLARVSAKHQ